MSEKYDFDVIIIGAGISGLVCGCYLSKAGLKVLIIEKNEKSGGYCTSFKKDGFLFDACAHSLGSCRKEGNITKMFEELGIKNRIKLKRHDPSDIIISPHYKISFHADINKTIDEFNVNFPKENKNIAHFFNSIVNSSDLSLLALRKKTFGSILNESFKDNKLKAILSFPILGNAGTDPSLISGFSSIMLYREFMLDGGYYPGNCMQDFTDILEVKFKELGGNLLLSNMVNKIKIDKSTARGVFIKNKNLISARYIVSACDAMQTFTKLIESESLDYEFIQRILKMDSSLSMLVLYLGIDSNLKISFPECTNIWYLPHYDMQKLYFGATNRTKNNLAEYMIRTLPDKKSLVVFVNSNFGKIKYWEDKKNKQDIINVLVKKIEKLIPHFSNHIILEEIATPHSLYKWTLNYNGASYGWSNISNQIMLPGFSTINSIKNLYLTGHWTTLAYSIRGVVYLGTNTAKLILKNL